MFNRTRRLVTSSRAALATGMVLATLVVSLGVAVPSSSALGTSAFCKTIFTYNAKAAVPPTKFGTASYRKWAAALLPFYEKLASEAPNTDTKNELNGVVTVLKYVASASSLTSLEGYYLKNHALYEKGAEALEKSIVACAK